MIDKDGHKEVLLNKGLDEELAGNIAYDLAFRTVYNELVKQQSSVILDTAALHTFIVDKVSEIVQSIENVRLKIILCVADRDLRNERILNRPKQITTIRSDPATMADYFYQFRHLPADSLTLHTRDPLEECLVAAKAYLCVEGCQ